MTCAAIIKLLGQCFLTLEVSGSCLKQLNGCADNMAGNMDVLWKR